MLMTVSSAILTWLSQVQNIVTQQFSHLSPDEYCIGLVFCICIGFVLLRGRA